MFRWLALIAAVVLIAALAGVILSSQHSSEPAPQQSAEKNHKEHAAEKNEIGLFDRGFPDSTAIFSLFLVIFTGVLAFGGLIQLNLLTRAERIAAESANAAKDAADAATKSANTARAALVVSQRAYVFLDEERPLEGPLQIGPGIEPSGMLRVKNSGQTPAFNIITLRATGSGPWPLPDQFDLTIKPTVEGAQIAPPGAITYWAFGHRQNPLPQAIMNQADYDAIKSGKLTFYIFGRITYSDIFGDPHWTNFCFAAEPPTAPGSIQNFGLRRCARHNDSDYTPKPK